MTETLVAFLWGLSDLSSSVELSTVEALFRGFRSLGRLSFVPEVSGDPNFTIVGFFFLNTFLVGEVCSFNGTASRKSIRRIIFFSFSTHTHKIQLYSHHHTITFTFRPIPLGKV